MRYHRARRAAGALLTAHLALVILSSHALGRQTAPDSAEVFISHLSPDYAAASDEFVVLFNNTGHALDLDGFELKYFSAAGSIGIAGHAFTGATVIPAKCYFLLATRETVQVGSAMALRDAPLTSGMASGGGQLVLRRTGSPAEVVFAAAWGTVTAFTAGMSDAAPWPGDGMLTLAPSGDSYVRNSATGSNTQYAHVPAGSIAAVPNSATPALPVEMTSFTAAADGWVVRLAWTTATETDNAGWEVERREIRSQISEVRNTASGWKKVGFVAGSGTSASPKEYAFEDNSLSAQRLAPSGSRFAYRLKQLDRTGSFSYSVETEVVVGAARREFSLLQSYPNPFNPSTAITFSVARTDRATLVVYDLLGREAAVLFEGTADAGRTYRCEWRADGMPTGVYVARLRSGGEVRTVKLVATK